MARSSIDNWRQFGLRIAADPRAGRNNVMTVLVFMTVLGAMAGASITAVLFLLLN